MYDGVKQHLAENLLHLKSKWKFQCVRCVCESMCVYKSLRDKVITAFLQHPVIKAQHGEKHPKLNLIRAEVVAIQ